LFDVASFVYDRGTVVDALVVDELLDDVALARALVAPLRPACPGHGTGVVTGKHPTCRNGIENGHAPAQPGASVVCW
jgi:hypothetical protein